MNIYQVANEMKIKHQTIFDLDIKVTYYVRVSTLREEQDGSVENQISYFENLISEHKNWTYIQGCVDRVRGKSSDCPTFAIYETELYDILGKFFVSIIDNLDDYINTFIEVYKKYDDSSAIQNKIDKIQNNENINYYEKW